MNLPQVNYPNRIIYHDFEFPKELVDMMKANDDVCPEICYMHLLPNPFMILLCLERRDTIEGAAFWAAVREKYIAEQVDPSEVTFVDILMLLSAHGK